VPEASDADLQKPAKPEAIPVRVLDAVAEGEARQSRDAAFPLSGRQLIVQFDRMPEAIAQLNT
jgi:hypothetical protein